MLNQQERDQLGRTLINAALLYGKETTPEYISQFISAMDNYFKMPLNTYLAAIQSYQDEGTNKFFPTPMSLRVYLQPKLDQADIAKLTSLKINEAVSKFGYSNYNDAMNYIGPLGKRVVDRFGGWNYLCENLGAEIQIGSFIAQAREVILSMQKEELIPIINQLEYSEKNKVEISAGLTSTNELLNKLTIRKGGDDGK